VKNDLSNVMQTLLRIQEMYVWNYFKTPDELQKHHMATSHAFTNHYREERSNKYIKSQLPFREYIFLCFIIPFFIYDILTYKFCKDSIQEVIKISKEVRIFPVICLNGKKLSFVD